MKPSLLHKTITALLASKASISLVGPPGIGKTSIYHQVATDMGWDGVRTNIHKDPSQQSFGYIEVNMPVMLVEDFGIPNIKSDGISFNYIMPSWFPYEGHPTFPKSGILNFDDRGQANADLQKVVANIQQAKNLHGVAMMEGWSVVSSGNRVSDRAGVSRTLTQLADREIELEYEVNLDDFCKWALNNNVHPAIIAYIRFKPDAMHDFDPNRDKNATPRGWCDPKDGVTAIIGNVPPEAEYEVFKGRVGEGRAIEFKSFMDMYRKLPNPDVVLMTPDTHEVPTEGSVLYALSGALAVRATDNNMDRVMAFAKRLPPEFTTLLVRDAFERDKSLASNQSFVQWVVETGADLLQ
jgi:hypothetical protein